MPTAGDPAGDVTREVWGVREREVQARARWRARSGAPSAGAGVVSLLIAIVLAIVAATVPSAALAQDEVPFITTPDHVTRAMLELAAVKADEVVIDLGSGDGRIVITGAGAGCDRLCCAAPALKIHCTDRFTSSSTVTHNGWPP